MKWSHLVASGAIFGAAAVAGGAVLIASSGPGSPDNAGGSPFSVATLDAFDSLSPTQLPKIPPADNILRHAGNGTVYSAATADGVVGYLAELNSGDVCVIISRAGTFGSGCGNMADVAAGRVVLRLQFGEQDPAVFFGVTSNDVKTVAIGGAQVPVENNVWLATVGPGVSQYDLFGTNAVVTVHLSDDPLTEEPAPSD